MINVCSSAIFKYGRHIPLRIKLKGSLWNLVISWFAFQGEKLKVGKRVSSEYLVSVFLLAVTLGKAMKKIFHRMKITVVPHWNLGSNK